MPVIRTIEGLLSLTVLILSADALAMGDYGAGEIQAVANTVIEDPNDSGPPKFQCGRFAVMAQLKCVECAYEPEPIDKHCDFSERGTSLLAVKEVLEAYGLCVTGVTGLTTAGLAEHLQAGGSSIVAVSDIKKDRGHFISVLGMSGRSFVYVDFPGGCGQLTGPQMEAALSTSGGTVLLISKPVRKRSESGDIVVVPSTVDLGELDVHGTSIVREVSIANRGSRHVVIGSVRAPCGCMKSELSSKWLRPGESSTLTLAVIPSKWGKTGAKTVYVSFPDGGLIPIAVNATMPALRIVLSPGRIYLRNEDFEATSEAVRSVRLASATGGVIQVEKAESDAEWVKPVVSTGIVEKPEVVLKCRQLAECGGKEAMVKVYCDGVSVPATIFVEQVYSSPFSVQPTVARLARNGEVSFIEVEASSAGTLYEVENVSCEDKRIKVSWEPGTTSGRSVIRVSYASDIGGSEETLGVQLVRVTVKMDRKTFKHPVAIVGLR